MANLPQHIIFNEILARLPAKSLIRFKCVSKAWYGTISSPEFAQEHLQKSHLFPYVVSNIFGGFINHDNNLGIASADNGNVVFQFRDWFLDKGKQTSILMFGSCNGLIGFMMYDFIFDNDDIAAMDGLNSHIPQGGIQFIIYNPILGVNSFVEIDLTTEVIIGDESGRNVINFGLIYISSIDDYRIIALGLPLSDIDGRVVVYHYSLRFKKWECLLLESEVIVEFRDPWFSSCNVLVKENLHWLTTLSSGELVITYLDLNNNKFSFFHLPSNIDISLDCNVCCLDGKLCVWGRRKCVYDCSDGYEIEMWNMREYGDTWMRVFVLRLKEECYDFLGSITSLLIQMDQGLLLVDSCGDTPNFLHVDFVIRKMVSYFGSLVSPLLLSSNQRASSRYDQQSDLEIGKGFTFNELALIQASTSMVNCCHFSSNGELFASGGLDKKVVLWFTDTRQPKSTLEEHTHMVTDVRFNPNKAWVATSSFDGTVRIWDIDNTGRSLNQFTGCSYPVMSVDFHPIDEIICFNFSNGETWLWSLFGSRPLGILEGGTVQVRFQPHTGKYLAAVSELFIDLIDMQRFFDTESFSDCVVGKLQGHSRRFRSCCWDPSGRLLACVSEDMISIWHVGYGWRRWRCVHQLTSTGNQFRNCVFHPLDPSLVVIGCNKNLELWNIAENKTTTLVAHEGQVTCLAASSVSGLVASASHDKCVKLWQSHIHAGSGQAADLYSQYTEN